jgi:hypothetical protein
MSQVMRGAIRARSTARHQLPAAAKEVFEELDIQQVAKKLHHYPTRSAQEYKDVVTTYDPDVVLLTLWFCGPSLNDTTPGNT